MTTRVRLHRWTAAWAIAGVCAATSACANNPPPNVASMPPGIHDDVKTVYYDVNPLSAAQFRQAMENEGLRHNNGAFAVGQSHIGISSAYDEEPGTDGCVIARVRVLVRSQMTIPHWDPPANVDPVITAAWREYVSKVTAHERTHVEISEKMGKTLNDSLGGLRAASCPELGRQARELEERLKSQERVAQADFDRKEGPAVWGYARQP